MIKYPIYIPSMGRAGKCQTVKLFLKHNIPFFLVVEKREYDAYVKALGSSAMVLQLPSSNYGTSTVARNFCIAHSFSKGFDRHWQFDDDITSIWEHNKGVKQSMSVNHILTHLELIADNDLRIGMIGMKTANFLKQVTKPYEYNTSLTSAFLINNRIGVKFRGIMYVDMDYQLQLLKRGYTTVKCQNYVFPFQAPMKHHGGYSAIYADDERRTAAINEFLNLNPDIKLEIHRNPQGYLALKNFGSVWRKYKLQK